MLIFNAVRYDIVLHKCVNIHTYIQNYKYCTNIFENVAVILIFAWTCVDSISISMLYQYLICHSTSFRITSIGISTEYCRTLALQ